MKGKVGHWFQKLRKQHRCCSQGGGGGGTPGHSGHNDVHSSVAAHTMHALSCVSLHMSSMAP